MLRINTPPEVIHHILLYILEYQDISPLNLVCRNFARILQPRQFAKVVLYNASRANELASLCTRNASLLNETAELAIGNESAHDSAELWKFISTPQGLQLLCGMPRVRCINMSNFTRALALNEAVMDPIKIWRSTGQVRRLIVKDSLILNIAILCQLIGLIHTIQEVEVHDSLRSRGTLTGDTKPHTRRPSHVESLQSLDLGRVHPRFAQTLVRQLAAEGLLDNLCSISVCCGYPFGFIDWAFSLEIAMSTVEELTVYWLDTGRADNLKGLDELERRHQREWPSPRPTMRRLGTLCLIGFTDGLADLLMRYMQPLPALKTLIRSGGLD
jgi:hypothetical protein